MTPTQPAVSTTLCRLWKITRKDGQVFGFCDHDRALTRKGQLYKAASGLNARALSQGAGLSVDNSEIWGALQHDALTQADFTAGRYDGAELRMYIADWTKPDDITEQFCGHLGEISHRGLEFRAEVLGLSESLGQDQGLCYGRECSATLGDARCKFDLGTQGYWHQKRLVAIDGPILKFEQFGHFDAGWFRHGQLEVLSGPATGLRAMIRDDRLDPTSQTRVIELWDSIRAPLGPNDLIGLKAGCDKSVQMCREKFGNSLNFRGFPYLPSEDWLSLYPRADHPQTGGSLSR